MTTKNQLEGVAGLGLVPVVPVRVVPAAAFGDLFGGQAEQEKIFLAGCVGHFNGGAVARADRQRAVHHEFHVAGAAGFVPGGGDLLRHIRRRDQALGQADVVIRQEDDLKPPARRRLATITVSATLLISLMMRLAR